MMDRKDKELSYFDSVGERGMKRFQIRRKNIEPRING